MRWSTPGRVLADGNMDKGAIATGPALIPLPPPPGVMWHLFPQLRLRLIFVGVEPLSIGVEDDGPLTLEDVPFTRTHCSFLTVQSLGGAAPQYYNYYDIIILEPSNRRSPCLLEM